LLVLSHAEIATLLEMVQGADRERVRYFDRIGVIVIDGAPLSHLMIRLLGLGITTVMVPAARLEVLKEGTALALDGGTGLIGDPLRVGRPPHRLNGALLIGAMAETPAAALAIDELADCADFAAVGCNDLMQCFFGVDRDVAELSP
jgi:hypothetical protein